MSSTILPRPSNPSLESTFIYDTSGQKIDSTRYSNYHSLVLHATYLRVLEDITTVEDITPGYSSARQTRNGCRVLYGLKKGDIVKILERWWEDYWLGECHGRRGFFLLDSRFVRRLLAPLHQPQIYLRRMFSLGIRYGLENPHNLVTQLRR